MSKSFGTRHVLDDVSFSAHAGQFVAIMGPSGSGKSTLLHLLAGLARPDAGSIHIQGVDIASLSDDAAADLRRDGIGFIFQSFNLIPVLTVVENIALPGRLAGVPARSGDERARALVSQLGLDDVAGALPATLSGGEQQRVAIARALFRSPGLLLADEPTGSLDAATGESVMAALSEARDISGATVVLVTHDPRAAAAADSLLHLEDGRLQAGVPTAAVGA